jgi:hypothetical protein
VSEGRWVAEQVPEVLTHYYRPCSRPFLSLSPLSDPELSAVLAVLARSEPLPYRLTHPAYLSERRRIEGWMRQRFVEKGGRPERGNPHYLVLGEFSLWEADGSLKVQVPLASVPAALVSFTLQELPGLIRQHGLPGDAWRSDPERRFDVYIEAQLWGDEPIERLLAAPGPSQGLP